MTTLHFLHSDVVLATVEAVRSGHCECPACHGRFLRDMKPLQPNVAIPTVLGELLSRFG